MSRSAIKIIILVLIPLSFSYILEFFFDVRPCRLCIYERLVYFAIFLSAILILFSKNSTLLKVYNIFMEVSIILLFCVNLIHYGIEKKILNFKLDCINDLNFTSDFRSFKAVIMDQEYVLCSHPGFEILGFSLTFWNLIYSIFLFVISLILFRGLWTKN